MQKKKYKKYKFFLFDLDGTLLDTAPEFHYSLNHLLKEENLPEIEYEPIKNKVSDGAGALISLGFNIFPDDEEFEKKRQKLLKIYEKVFLKSKPFQNIDELILSLSKKDISWGIVTNKPKFFAEKIFTNLQWNLKTNILICPEDVNHIRKPDPASLKYALKNSSYSKKETVYIGDNWRDIEAAHSAKIDSVLALYGYLDKSSAKNISATSVVHEPKDIIQFI